MNEKKIRRDVRIYKVLGPVCMLAAFGFFVWGFHFLGLGGDNKTLEPWMMLAYMTGYVADGAALVLVILSCLCLVLQRQAEYTLFLKEALLARSEGRIGDASPNASPLSKAA